MIEREIIKLLTKISNQLEEISESQATIKAEIQNLQMDLAHFEKRTLQNLEDRLMRLSPEALLN